jgi:ribonuclease M5
MRIRETIVVEGIHDKARLLAFIEANIICSDGTHISVETLRQLQQAYKEEGLIIFSDPDTPGQALRHQLSQYFPLAKHAYISQSKARSNRKIGIEHASEQDILMALEHVHEVQEHKSDLNMGDLMDLGLSGSIQAKLKRIRVAHHLFLSEASAKTFLKQCQHKGLQKADLKGIIEAYGI